MIIFELYFNSFYLKNYYHKEKYSFTLKITIKLFKIKYQKFCIFISKTYFKNIIIIYVKIWLKCQCLLLNLWRLVTLRKITKIILTTYTQNNIPITNYWSLSRYTLICSLFIHYLITLLIFYRINKTFHIWIFNKLTSNPTTSNLCNCHIKITAYHP